jgi:hypothetical protein
MADKNGGRYIKEFADQMERQLGMKMVIMTAHVDSSEVISYSA